VVQQKPRFHDASGYRIDGIQHSLSFGETAMSAFDLAKWNANHIIDLTKHAVEVKIEFDTLDAVLLVATGGVGLLARRVYDHVTEIRPIDNQKDFSELISEAESKGVTNMVVNLHPRVSVYAPNGGQVTLIESGDGYKQYKISFGKKKKATGKKTSKGSTSVFDLHPVPKTPG
jgi:hypothetical protein